MARSLGKYTLGFGMVVIPVQLYGAVSEDKDTPFHQVRAADGSRIQYRRVAAVDGEEVAYSDIRKGYEAPDGRMVVLSDEEVDAAYGEKNRAITMKRHIRNFEVPPRAAHDKTYYVQALPGGEQAYAILQAALEVSGSAVEVTFAIRQKESYGVLYASAGILMLERVLYPARVNEIPFEAPELTFLTPELVEMAQSLLATLPDGPGWSDETDRTQATLTAAVEAKLAGGLLLGTPAERPAVTQPADLMAALRASVDKARAEQGKVPAKPAAQRKTQGRRKAVA